jgi:hypothetical protein
MLSVIAVAIALAAQPELCARGAGPLRNLNLPGGVQIAGAGRTDRGDTTWVGWTGAQCTAWISWRGNIRIADDERSVFPMPGSFLAVHAESGVPREYRVVDSAGRIAETFTENGRTMPIGPTERDWIASAVAEFARRVPIAPGQRAARILEKQGLDSLVAEAMRVPRDEIRAEYLIMPLLSSAVPVDKRADFIRRASFELGTSDGLARFLLSVPLDWRRDSLVTLRVLTAASRIEPDEFAVNVLRRTLPGGPLAGDFAEAVRSIIATLQTTEQRQELTALYFGPKP